uniref:RloB-like protein n=1 Tax=Candidatus Kentrum sp. DK TaxID=2126562 RepID=A0A450SLP3_9GAMM|nr:MAG: RloB-like protein [Candidatus Kentron sp. DK]
MAHCRSYLNLRKWLVANMVRRKGREPIARRQHRPDRKIPDYGHVLIICEGEKSEPIYFNELRKHYQMNNVVVTSADGTDPVSIVRTARHRQKEADARGKPYDRVYCVFDRDEHANFDDASQQLEYLRKRGFYPIRSWPCFEFWLLLHFTYTRRPFERDGRQTAARNCESALRREMPHYRKGATGVFMELLPRLEAARERAARAREDAKATLENNPSTEVHELVDYLRRLRMGNGPEGAALC